MSADILDRVIAAEEALIRALDGRDPAAIDAAVTAFTGALDVVRGAGAWRNQPAIIARLTRAIQLADAARARINYLADRTRCQLEQLAVLGVNTPQRLAYGRPARIA